MQIKFYSQLRERINKCSRLYGRRRFHYELRVLNN